MSSKQMPVAKLDLKNIVKIGSIVVKPEKPSESMAEAKESIEILEMAVKDRVFIENGRASE